MLKIILMIVLALILIGICLKFVKGILKFIITVFIVIAVLASFNLIKIESVVPSKYVNALSKQVDTINELKAIAKGSKDSVKVNVKDSKVEIQVKIENEWISLDEIDKIQKTAFGKIFIKIKDREIEVIDNTVKDVLSVVTKDN